jgi:hypothetical protein
VYNVDKWLINRLVLRKNKVDNNAGSVCIFWWKVGELSMVPLWRAWEPGYILCSASTTFPGASTGFAQVLRIQSVLDFGDCSADVGIEAGFLFDLLNRMDGGRVVFASKLAGNLREA